MFGRQTTGSVVCSSCGRLVGVNDETCYNCGRRNPGLWGFGPAAAAARQRPRVRAAGHVGIDGAVRRDAAHVGQRHPHGRHVLVPRPEHAEPVPVRRQRRASPVFRYDRWWTVLSAGWLHSGILHILFNMMWVRQLGPVCAELYGAGRMVDHLHRRGGDRVRGEFGCVAVLRRHPDSRRRRLHRWRVGAHLRPARRDRALRPALGQQHGTARRPPVRADARRVRPDHAGHRQLGARRAASPAAG